MNRSPLKNVLRLALATACVMASAEAAVVVNYSAESGVTTNDGTIKSFTPSWGTTVSPANNVLAGLTPATTGVNFALEGAGGVPVLNNGVIGPITRRVDNVTSDPAQIAIYATVGNGQGSGSQAGTSLTYTLTVPTQLVSIGTYGGWQDSGRDEQDIDVTYSTDGGLTYLALFHIVNKPTGTPASTPSAVRSILTDDGGVLAGGAVITNLKFNFAAGGVENGWTGLSEVTAYAVPEPTGALLGLLGGLSLLRRRRNA